MNETISRLIVARLHAREVEEKVDAHTVKEIVDEVVKQFEHSARLAQDPTIDYELRRAGLKTLEEGYHKQWSSPKGWLPPRTANVTRGACAALRLMGFLASCESEKMYRNTSDIRYTFHVRLPDENAPQQQEFTP